MSMEGGPKFNPAPLEETPAEEIDEKFADVEVADLHKEILRQLDLVYASLPQERKKEFELKREVFLQKVSESAKLSQEDFLRNMANARNLKDVVAKRKRILFLHNNLRSHLKLIRENILSNFLADWVDDRGEEPLKLAA